MSNAATSKHILFIAPSSREACTGISPLRLCTISLFLNLFFSYFFPRAGRTPLACGPFASTIADLPAPHGRDERESSRNERGGQESGDDNRCRIPEYWPGRLEIRGAVRPIAGAAGQTATRTIARDEFKVIGARSDGAHHDCEGAVSMNVGRDNTEFHCREAFGHTLPCDRAAGTVTGRKLAEGRGKCGAEDVDIDLIELAGPRAYQSKGHRQFARRRVYGPTYIAA